METTTRSAGEQTRLDALDRAISYHAQLERIGSADDVIETARGFEKYLNGPDEGS